MTSRFTGTDNSWLTWARPKRRALSSARMNGAGTPSIARVSGLARRQKGEISLRRINSGLLVLLVLDKLVSHPKKVIGRAFGDRPITAHGIGTHIEQASCLKHSTSGRSISREPRSSAGGGG